jgi:hypothetical protein
VSRWQAFLQCSNLAPSVPIEGIQLAFLGGLDLALLLVLLEESILIRHSHATVATVEVDDCPLAGACQVVLRKVADLIAVLVEDDRCDEFLVAKPAGGDFGHRVAGGWRV